MSQDEDWEPFDEKATVADERTPVPEAVPEHASTGKYKTLSGFEAAAAKEISGARDLLLGRDQVYTAFRLWLMSRGVHPDAAQLQVEALRKWHNENEELVRAAMP